MPEIGKGEDGWMTFEKRHYLNQTARDNCKNCQSCLIFGLHETG